MLNRARHTLLAHRAGVAAAALLTLAVTLRVLLVRAGWPGTDSDDATMGLMAKHILTHGELPIFFWGQAYMGTLEAYLGALMFAVFGVSEAALKYGLIVLYAGFLVVMYALLARAFNRRWALVGLLLLSLGADDMLYHQLEAYGGYLETLLFGALMIVLAAWLIRPWEGPTARRRPWIFGAWGLAAGLGIWSDPLVAPFVGLSALFLALTCWRELRSRLGMLALAGLLLGLSPWIIYLVTAPSLDAAKSFLQHAPQQHTVVTTTPAAPSGGAPTVSVTLAPAGPGLAEALTDRVLGTVFISVPNTTGATTLCPLTVDEAWPPQHWTTPRIQGCMALRGVWGGSFLALLALALTLEARAFLALWRIRPANWHPAERVRATRSAARLMALGAPAATVLLFTLSSAASTTPWQYSRYLISLLIALPVLCATLWEHAGWRLRPRLDGTRATKSGRRPAARYADWEHAVPRLGVACLVGALVVTLGVGVVGAAREIPATQARERVDQDLMRRLLQQGDTRIYTEFWTCYHTMFRSDERIICGVINTDLTHRPSRYAPYDALVQAAPHPVYVFPLDTPQAASFPVMAARQGWRLDRATVDNRYVIFTVLGTPG